MLYGAGLSDEDMGKAQVGISSVWFEGNTCNMHLNSLAAKVKEGVEKADLIGMRFNTIGVSDGISMGTEGMSYSLPSRDLIADSIETVMRAQWYDANIALPGCDKNMPGCLIAMARVNRPALMVYGGTIRAGELEGQPLDIVSAFQSYGEYLAGRIDETRRQAIVRHSCPGAGACGGMYTANTMASAIEALGIPHTEVDLLLSAGSPLPFSQRIHGGETIEVLPTLAPPFEPGEVPRPVWDPLVAAAEAGRTVVAPIGRVVCARSGDKGGDANLGVWARDDAAYAWLNAFLATDRLQGLLP